MRFLLGALAATVAAAAAASASPPPVPAMEAATLAYIAQMQRAVLRRDFGTIAVRDVAAAAWASFTVGTPNASLAVAMLDAVFATQLPDGQFPWQFDQPGVDVDANSVQFTALPVLLAVAGGHVPAAWVAARAAALTSAANASIAEAAFEAFPWYTNIYSMRAVNLALFAQVLPGNATIAAAADAALATWAATVDGAGLREFDSPTYSAVTLANLYAGAGAVANATRAAALRRLLGYAAADAAAHWFPPARGLGGAHSRDYDFLYGAAGMDWWAVLSGLAGACDPAAAANASWVSRADMITMAHLYVQYRRGRLPPLPAPLLAVGCGGKPAGGDSAPPAWRVVQASASPWVGQVGPLNGTDRYTFGSRVVTLGSTSAYYGAQDKLLVGALPAPVGAPSRLPRLSGGARLAQVTAVLDRFDAPYGLVKSPDASGHEKPTHLRPGVATAADGAAVLLLLDLTPQWETDRPGTVYASVGANVVLPAGAGVDAMYVGAPGGGGGGGGGGNTVVTRVANVSAGAPALPVPLDGGVVGVRAGGGLVGVRLWALDALAPGAPPPTAASLRFDGPPGSDASRLVGYLYGPGPNVSFAGGARPASSRVGLLVVGAAAAGDDDAAAVLGALAAVRISSTLAGGVWSVTAAPGDVPPPAGAYPGLGSTLAAALSLARGEPAARAVNGSAMAMPPPGAVRLAYADGTVDLLRPGDFNYGDVSGGA